MLEGRQFGLVIAYLLPGFIGLAGLAPWLPMVNLWLQPIEDGAWGIGPPVYALLAAMTVGMIISCVRWLIIDHLLERTGVPKAVQAYEQLPHKLHAYDYLIEVHYRYYQFHSNALVAIVWAYLANRIAGTHLSLGTDLGVAILCAILFAGARDTLAKHRRKLSHVLNADHGERR